MTCPPAPVDFRQDGRWCVKIGVHSRKRGRRIEGRRRERREGARARSLIQPERKDPASKFIESSHDFTRSGAGWLRKRRRSKEREGDKSTYLRAVVWAQLFTLSEFRPLSLCLSLSLSLPPDQALGNNKTLCPIKPMAAGVASVHSLGKRERAYFGVSITRWTSILHNLLRQHYGR